MTIHVFILKAANTLLWGPKSKVMNIITVLLLSKYPVSGQKIRGLYQNISFWIYCNHTIGSFTDLVSSNFILKAETGSHLHDL